MHKWARIAVVVLLVWVAAVVFWSVRPWSDTQLLRTPPKLDARSVTYECGAVFGSATAEAASDAPPKYPLSRTPCDGRSQRRGLALADVGLAAVALVAVLALGRRRDAAGAHEDAVPAPQ